MNKKISTSEIEELAKEFHLSTASVKAVIIVESSNGGFNADGSLKIQFEPHHFKKRSGETIVNGVEVQKKEWEAYNKAAALDKEAAMLSTSWGMAQIMGFNFKAAGYESVTEMVNEFKISEFFQVRAMLRYIQSDSVMYNALKNNNWKVFARCYNGPLYTKFQYDTRLLSAFLKSK